MSIIEAKCPNCGAPIELNTDNDACYCEYCKTPFTTDKVMNFNGDYVHGNKIVNNVKQDNEWSYAMQKDKIKESDKAIIGLICLMVAFMLMSVFAKFVFGF